ncbi:MAG: rhodanese-like domain-containing protein [Halobacteriaceae archaeon]
MPGIGPATLDERLDAVFVLDIRPAEDYDDGHIPTSYNAPVYEALQRGDIAALEEHLGVLPDDREVVTVCKAGLVARRATTYLETEGYPARTLTGGYAGWRQYEADTFLYRVVAAVGRLVA